MTTGYCEICQVPVPLINGLLAPHYALGSRIDFCLGSGSQAQSCAFCD